MSLRRKILFILLIIPAAAIVFAIIRPGTASELAFLVLGVPILVLNVWEFFSAEAGDPSGGNPEEAAAASGGNQEEALLRKRILLALIIIVFGFILLVGGYALVRSRLDKVTFLYALAIFLIKLASKLWHLLTRPVFFISILAFLLLGISRKQIINVIKEMRGNKSVKFPDVFYPPVLLPIPKDNSQTSTTVSGKANHAEAVSTMEALGGNEVDLKTMRLILDLDGKDVAKPELLSRIEELGINSAGLPAKINKAQKEAFQRGVLETLYGQIFPNFCKIELKGEGKVARFTLKEGVRERFLEKLKPVDNPGGSFDI